MLQVQEQMVKFPEYIAIMSMNDTFVSKMLIAIMSWCIQMHCSPDATMLLHGVIFEQQSMAGGCCIGLEVNLIYREKAIWNLARGLRSGPNPHCRHRNMQQKWQKQYHHVRDPHTLRPPYLKHVARFVVFTFIQMAMTTGDDFSIMLCPGLRHGEVHDAGWHVAEQYGHQTHESEESRLDCCTRLSASLPGHLQR